MLNNYSCRSPLGSSSVFSKSGVNFYLDELANPKLVGYKFTENFSEKFSLKWYTEILIESSSKTVFQSFHEAF